MRSAKTWAVNAKLIGMLSGAYPDWTWPGGIGLITANSKTSARTNILSDVFNIVGEKRYRYNQQSGELILFGRPFLVCGARDEAAWKSIRGSTVGLWIADEMTIYPRSFFDMALSRLSLPGSRAYGTTNPGSPFHYLKADYLDRRELREQGELWSEHYTLADNPNINERTKESFRRMYTGVFKRWYIDGEWCVAEGSIFGHVITDDIFYDDATRPLALLSRGGHQERWVAVDAGTVNAQCYGEFIDDGRTVWLENSYYWDSKKQNRQKTNAEYADDLINGYGEWPGLGPDKQLWPGVVVDPSAASFKVELASRGVWVVDADNEVIDGIRRVSAMLGQKKLKIHKRCVDVRRDLETYTWDDKAAARGEEKPVKSHDHGCFVAGTLIRTPGGQAQVETLKVGDSVVTPLGVAKILDVAPYRAQTVAWNGTRVTSEHPIFTPKGLVRVDALTCYDEVCAWNQSYSTERVAHAPGITRVWTMFPDLARFAALTLASTNTLRSAPVAEVADENSLGEETVYAIRTEHGCYFANDVLVSNCDMVKYYVNTKINDWRIAS